MQPDCLICNRIEKILEGKNPYFVTELETGYVVLGDYQFFKGYTLFLCKEHKTELHELSPKFRKKFLWEMSLVAEAVYHAFQPKKLNYELLGNGEPHLHWHVFPRYQDDPNPTEPIWLIDKKVRNADHSKPSNSEMNRLKEKLMVSLEEILKNHS